MKRGWIFLIAFLLIVTTAFVSAKTYNFSGCYVTSLCQVDYVCGHYDNLCAQDFLTGPGTCELTFLEVGYMKCLDPDCTTCIQGIVVRADDPTEGVVGATITYKQDVWNKTAVETIQQTTTTDGLGNYMFSDVGAGNEIYLTAEANGFTPDLEILFDHKPGPCTQVDFTLSNGSCENDCTRMGSNYCDSSCQGTFDPAGGNCTYNISTSFDSRTITSPFEACTGFGIQKTSFVDVGNYTNAQGERICIRVNCCEGSPFEVPCPEPTISPILMDGSSLDNAIKITRIAKYKGEAIKIRIYYWE